MAETGGGGVDWPKKAAELQGQVRDLQAANQAKMVLGMAQVELADAELALLDAEKAQSKAKGEPRSVYRDACKALLTKAKAVESAAGKLESLNRNPRSQKLADDVQKAIGRASKARGKVGLLIRLGL